MIQFENDNIDELVKGKVAIIDFYADWCGPCKMLTPILEDIISENRDVKVIKINIDDYEDIAKQFGVMSIPTLVLFKDGKLINKKVGFLPKEDILDWIG